MLFDICRKFELKWFYNKTWIFVNMHYVFNLILITDEKTIDGTCRYLAKFLTVKIGPWY